MFILLALLLMHCYSTTAFPATYYIDYVSGKDYNKGTSPSAPWKLCPGMTGFSGKYTHHPGDVFVFKGGSIWTQGTANNTVLFISYSGISGHPDVYMGGQQCGYVPAIPYQRCDGTIACGSTASVSCNDGKPWGKGYAIFTSHNSVSTAKGIYTMNPQSNLVFDGLELLGLGYTDGTGFGMAFSGGSNIETKNCYFNTNAVDAWVYGSGGGAVNNTISFHDNTIINSGRVHFLAGADSTVDNVQFYSNLYMGPGSYNPVSYHCDGFMIGGDGVTHYAVTNLKIYNNKFYGNWSTGATAAIYLNGTGNSLATAKLGTAGVEIYNNVIVPENNTCRSAVFSPGAITIYNGHHKDIKIYNNTISGDACTTKTMTGIALGLVENIDIKNNIISGVDNAIILGNAGWLGTATADNNLFHTIGGNHLLWDKKAGKRYDTCVALQAAGWGTTYCANSDPKFIALPRGGVTGSGDLQLQATSPAKGAGTDLSTYFTTDLLGNTRSGKWDIGALNNKTR